MADLSRLMILGDWGTSVCRLYLCDWRDDILSVVARKKGPGIKHTEDHESSFFELCQPWFDQHGKMPVFLIGTVGADIGWKTAPYVKCPTDQHQLLSEAAIFEARGIDFTIIPGLSCLNRHGLPDIMRSEETQIFGFLAQQHPHPKEQLICLPGTHTKWALLKEDKVASFLTSPIGELYEVLSHHTVLLAPMAHKHWNEESFVEGLEVGLRQTSNLLHTLFATRALQVLNENDNTQAASFLSGLLIGADVKAAMQDFHLFSHVTLIGSERINGLYKMALDKLGINSNQVTSESSTLSGLKALASEKWRESDGA